MSAQSSLWACNAHAATLLLALLGQLDSSGFPFLSAPGETEWRVCVVPPAFYFVFKKNPIYIWSSNYLIKIQYQDENPPKEAAGLQQQLYKC